MCVRQLGTEGKSGHQTSLWKNLILNSKDLKSETDKY